VSDVIGDVLIVCRGIDPALLQPLNQQLSQTKSTLNERIKRADNWVRRYSELSTELSRNGDESGRARLAAERLKVGDLAGAESILRDMTTGTNPVVRTLAQAHYDLARVLDLRFKPDEALTQYARAVELQPERGEYLRRYGYTLIDVGRTREGEDVLERVLRVIERESVDSSGDALQSNTRFRAEISSNLGVAYRRTRDYVKSERYDLAAADLYEVAGDLLSKCEALNNLETSYEFQGRLSEAREVGERTLETLRRITRSASGGTDEQRLAVLRAGLLVNMSFLYHRMDLDVESAAAIREALPQIRRLYERDPVTQARLLGIALVRDGERLEEAGDGSEAEKQYAEAYVLLKARARFTPDDDQAVVETGMYLAKRLLPQRRVSEAADIAVEILPIARRLYASDNSMSPTLVDALLLAALVSNVSNDGRLPTPCDALREAVSAATDDEMKKRLQQGLALC